MFFEDAFFALIPPREKDWFVDRQIPMCVYCLLHLMEHPERRRTFERLPDSWARAYFGFTHLRHLTQGEGDVRSTSGAPEGGHPA